MCIIAIKKKGITLPSERTLETMFKNNPDGAGFMYAADNKVVIEKGFMSYKAFKSAIKKIEDKHDIESIPLVMHFRIATSGQVDAGTCHPFPIASKRKHLRKQYIETDIGVVHNGIIPIAAPDNMSDTMQYIKENLTSYKGMQSDFYAHKRWKRRIEKEIMSKMAFLDNNGDIHTIGDYIKEPDGMVYSNRSFEERLFSFGYDSLFDLHPRCKLCPIDGYLTMDGGNIIDCDDGLYLISKHGQVYEYDFAFDIAVPIDATAYTYESMPYYYDETKAMYFNTPDHYSLMME